MIDFSRLQPGRANLLSLRRVSKFSMARAEEEVRARAQYAYLGDRLGICRVLGRFKMYVDPQDIGHSSHLILDGAWELWVTRFLITRLREGMVAVDVGANLGYFSLIMAEMVGSRGVVHAFEPNSEVADRMARSTIVNGFETIITLHREAVGAATEGVFKLVVPDGLPSGAWLVPVGAVEEGSVVPMRRLDDYPELVGANIVKIDAEGFEYEVWKGMANCIARGHPMVILLEFANGRYAEGPAFVDDIFASGFSISVIEHSGRLRRVIRQEILNWQPSQDVMLVLERV